MNSLTPRTRRNSQAYNALLVSTSTETHGINTLTPRTRRISRAYNALSESISGGTHGMNSLTPRTRRNSRAYDALIDFGNRMVRYSHWIRTSNDLLTSIFELNRPTFEWRKVCSPKYENHKNRIPQTQMKKRTC